VTKVDSQEETLKTVMTATPVPWKEAPKATEIDFGFTSLTELGYKRLRIRGIEDLAQRAPQESPLFAEGNATMSLVQRDKSFTVGTMNVNVGTPGRNIPIWKDPTKYGLEKNTFSSRTGPC
jgi:hypothetical protein